MMPSSGSHEQIIDNHDQVEDEGSDGDGDGNTGKPSNPLQKRRRITRACDPCRLRKIKCTGEQPCTHCSTYYYDCTYDQPSQRRRNPPAYVEALEARLDRAEKLLGLIAPNIDLNDASLDSAIRSGSVNTEPGVASMQNGGTISTGDSSRAQSQGKDANVEQQETALESMIRAVGQIELDEHGNWDFHGHSSGLSFMRQMRAELGSIMGPDTQSVPYLKALPTTRVLDTPKSPSVESTIGRPTLMSELPPRDLAEMLCSATLLSFHSGIMKVVHGPSFWQSFERVYSTSPDSWSAEDRKFLPVLYAALAAGILYSRHDAQNYQEATDKGYKYFKAARQLIDVTDIRDLASIQAVIFLILFLQSSSRLAQSYSWIGIALRAAIRLGLHRSLSAKGFTTIEVELRRQVWWTVRNNDVYIGALVGLPQGLSEEDIDQELPSDVDDEHITEEGIQHPPPGTITSMTAFRVHARLLCTLTKIVKSVYPLSRDDVTKAYTIPFSVIQEIEQDLEQWKASLPSQLDPTYDDPKLARAQQSLRLAYAFCQLLLYRPFLHFVAAGSRARPADQRGLACAKSYIGVCRNLISLSDSVHRKGVLRGHTWFLFVLTYFAILSLVYYAAENPDSSTSVELMKDAIKGKGILEALKSYSLSADRSSSTLEVIFGRLPEWMREGRPNPMARKKRKAIDSGVAAKEVSRPPHAHDLTLHDMKTTPLDTSNPRIAVTTTDSAFEGKIKMESSMRDRESDSPAGILSPAGFFSNSPIVSPPGFLYEPLSANGSNVSAMMFSDIEPFTYPTQPMSWYRANPHVPLPPTLNMDMIMPTAPARGAVDDGDKLEAQLYTMSSFMVPSEEGAGMVWPYGQQAPISADVAASLSAQRHDLDRDPPQQPSMNVPRQQQRQSFQNTMQNQYVMPMQQGTPGNWPGSQQSEHLDGLNLHEIFGGAEWVAPFLNQRYGQ